LLSQGESRNFRFVVLARQVGDVAALPGYLARADFVVLTVRAALGD
jgi:hypothetical protein